MRPDDGGRGPGGRVVEGLVPAVERRPGIDVLDAVAGVAVAVGQRADLLGRILGYPPRAVGDHHVAAAVGVLHHDLDQQPTRPFGIVRAVGASLTGARLVVVHHPDGHGTAGFSRSGQVGHVVVALARVPARGGLVDDRSVDLQLPVAHRGHVGTGSYDPAAGGDLHRPAGQRVVVAGVVSAGVTTDPLCTGPVVVAEPRVEASGCRGRALAVPVPGDHRPGVGGARLQCRAAVRDPRLLRRVDPSRPHLRAARGVDRHAVGGLRLVRVAILRQPTKVRRILHGQGIHAVVYGQARGRRRGMISGCPCRAGSRDRRRGRPGGLRGAHEQDRRRGGAAGAAARPAEQRPG